MITEKDIKEYWGNSLVKISSNILEESNLSSETKSFLQRIGLPMKDNEIWMHFTPENIYTLAYKNVNYTIIGQADKSQRLGIQEDNDEVFYLWDDAQGKTHLTGFLSSNIKSLIIFLQLFHVNYPIVYNTASHAQRKEMLAELAEQLKQIDPKPLLIPENEWVYMLNAWEWPTLP